MPDARPNRPGELSSALRIELFRDVVAGEDPAPELEETLAWLYDQRSRPVMSAERIGLAAALSGSGEPAPLDERALESSLVFVRTTLKEREVMRWSQPLMISKSRGFCGLVVSRAGERFRALMQVAEEPGIIDGAQIGPTVQVGMSFARQEEFGDVYLGLFEDAPSGASLFEVAHSEEGGRFYRDEIVYAAVLADDPPAIETERHRWVSVAALKEAISHENVLNIHARTLLCMLL